MKYLEYCNFEYPGPLRAGSSSKYSTKTDTGCSKDHNFVLFLQVLKSLLEILHHSPRGTVWKALKMDHVMDAVVKVVNEIRARDWNIANFGHSWKNWTQNTKTYSTTKSAGSFVEKIKLEPNSYKRYTDILDVLMENFKKRFLEVWSFEQPVLSFGWILRRWAGQREAVQNEQKVNINMIMWIFPLYDIILLY